MRKKIFIISTIIFFLLLISLLFIFHTSNTTQLPSTLPTPTPVSLPTTTKQLPSSPIVPTGEIDYKQGSEEKVIENMANRQPLSQNDIQAKNTINTSLNNQSGSPEETNEFRVDYLHNNDIFQVEILTTNIDQAKKDALQWFLSQGFTQDGLCKLPVSFYLNFDVKQQLQQSGKSITFNPLADFCQ